MHRLDRISAKKPGKLLDSKSLTLAFSHNQIWQVFLPYSERTIGAFHPLSGEHCGVKPSTFWRRASSA